MMTAIYTGICKFFSNFYRQENAISCCCHIACDAHSTLEKKVHTNLYERIYVQKREKTKCENKIHNIFQVLEGNES